jgi:serine/threonine-protein kinase HipA
MICRIEVWISLAGGRRLAGEMVCDVEAGGRGRGAFRYDQGYLRSSEAFALDPVSLPLQGGAFSVDHPGIFGVFEDSLPDDWGRRLLVRKHRIPPRRQNLPTLLRAQGGSGLGALSYSERGRPEVSAAEVSVIHLERLVQAAEMFERGENQDEEISLLLGAGTSPGGARPKALVFDEQKGEHCLAKFPSIKDQVNVVGIEAATMSLAARAGLVVPESHLVRCGSRPVLLVRRFDLMPQGRRHMVSLQTLMKAKGYYVCRYGDLLHTVRKVSADPVEDGERLFRQMVFNAVVNNTDDHLKNFWMLYDNERGWRLSPAFDLVPDIGQNGEHVLFFDLDPVYPGRKNLERLGRDWGVPRADRIVEAVFATVGGWKDEFASFGVSGADIARFSEIDDNLQR